MKIDIIRIYRSGEPLLRHFNYDTLLILVFLYLEKKGFYYVTSTMLV